MPTLKVPVASHDHIAGDPNAPAVLVQYGDFQCPACRMAHRVVSLVQQHFDRNLCFVFRHFPLTEVHPLAGPAAEAAEFAGAHGRFWPMHDALYENQPRLSQPLLFSLAGALGLSQIELRDALVNGTYLARIQADFIGGVRSGVNGTPTFFINGQRHDASFAFPELVAAINQAMQHSATMPMAR